MSRTLKEIYDEAVRERNKRMELNEFSSDSKLSILNGIAWTVAAVIHSFETLLDVFAYDISETINRRSEEHRLNSSHKTESRMPSSA